MFKKVVVPGREIYLDGERELRELSPLLELLFLIKSIAQEVEIRPCVYQNAPKTVLRVQFPSSCVAAADFVDSYGALIGRVSDAYPLVINGQKNQLEEGTLAVEALGDGYRFNQLSASGRGFDTLSHFYLEIGFDSGDECDFVQQAVRDLDPEKSYAAMSRRWDAFPFAQALFEKSDVFYFRYLNVGIDAVDLYEELPGLLSMDQVVELWTRFLQGGASWAEFETAQNAITNGSCDGLYDWELALKVATESIGVSIVFSENGVHVFRQNGEQLKLGYNNTTGAEKLFAKIISPA